MEKIKRKVQVSIPFTMLHDTYLERFLTRRLNAEISLGAESLDRFERLEFIRIAQKFHQLSLQITLHGPFMDLALGSSDRAVRGIARRRLEQMLALVPIFKPKTVVCHAGYDRRRYGYNPDGWYERSLEQWRWLAGALTDCGARLMLENVYEQDPGEMVPLFEALEPLGAGFCLDVGHLESFGTGSIHHWCEVLGPYIGQLHLHDNHGNWDDHLGLGKGRIDFKGLLSAVKSVCTQQPVVTLEVHREEELLPSLNYLERIWPW